jgi:uncharacterized protein
MKTKLLTFLLALTFLFLFSGSVYGDDLQDGYDAYDRKDYKTAHKLLLPLAEQGVAKAQSILGWLYYKGLRVRQDYKQALKWTRLALEQGFKKAQNNMGVMYAEGEAVPQDYKEAFKLFSLSAEQGVAKAQHNLGYMYDEGKGVPQDYKEAVKWYQLSAEQGYADAQVIVGFKYNEGQGVPQNYEEAIKWWRLAADQGSSQAQNNLGLTYARGEGVPQDYVSANMWFILAAGSNYSEGIKNRKVMEERMTPQQIAKAQEMARNWKPIEKKLAEEKRIAEEKRLAFDLPPLKTSCGFCDGTLPKHGMTREECVAQYCNQERDRLKELAEEKREWKRQIEEGKRIREQRRLEKEQRRLEAEQRRREKEQRRLEAEQQRKNRVLAREKRQVERKRKAEKRIAEEKRVTAESLTVVCPKKFPKEKNMITVKGFYIGMNICDAQKMMAEGKYKEFFPNAKIFYDQKDGKYPFRLQAGVDIFKDFRPLDKDKCDTLMSKKYTMSIDFTMPHKWRCSEVLTWYNLEGLKSDKGCEGCFKATERRKIGKTVYADFISDNTDGKVTSIHIYHHIIEGLFKSKGMSFQTFSRNFGKHYIEGKFMFEMEPHNDFKNNNIGYKYYNGDVGYSFFIKQDKSGNGVESLTIEEVAKVSEGFGD